MSDSIDPHSLTREYPVGNCLHEEPSVWLFENFASSEEIAALRAAAWEKLQPAQVSGDKEGYVSPGRSGSNCWIPHAHDALTLQLADKVSKLVKIPLNHAENFQVVYYGVDQEYKAHYDAWDTDSERGIRCMEKGGQRLITTLIYLNHVDAGGATGFPKLDIDVYPLPGNLLLFHNCYKGTISKHIDSLHGGLPVTQGEKWAANLWFRERPLRK